MRMLTQLDLWAERLGEDTMRLLPLSQWKCDACGQIIERAEMGWVLTLSTAKRNWRGHMDVEEPSSDGNERKT
jgi:hypothetical protein